MDLIRQTHRLVFSPIPHKENHQEWESILNLGTCKHKQEIYILLSDIDNEELIYSCFANITEGNWADYLHYDNFEYYVFAWSFDGTTYVSDNPFFEILMRTLRKFCIAFNQNDTLTSRQIGRWKEIIDESLKQLHNLEDTSPRVETFVKYGVNTHYDFTSKSSKSHVIKWLTVDFFSALFALVCLENEKKQLIECVRDTLQAGNDTCAQKYVQFDKPYRKLSHFIRRVCMCTNNNLVTKTTYITYIGHLIASKDGLLPLLKQIMAVMCSATTSLADLPNVPKRLSTDDVLLLEKLQPSVLRAMKNNTNKVLSKLIDDNFMLGTDRAHLHENDTKNEPKIFSLFDGSDQVKEKSQNHKLSTGINDSLLGHIQNVVSITSYQSFSRMAQAGHALQPMKKNQTGNNVSLREPINVVIEESVAREIRQSFSPTSRLPISHCVSSILKSCCPF